ncbi:phage minor capsid protein [Nocardia sp. NPDC059239]|uniref:phage minor capsid protein n=1 Tax=unclassified Nocardia TaxID=2637762 RepID=UPI00368057C3
MPLTPSNGDGHIGPVRRAYERTEELVWRALSRILVGERWKGLPWPVRMLMKLPGFRNTITNTMTGFTARIAVLILAILTKAFKRGARQADTDLKLEIPGGQTLPGHIGTLVDSLRRRGTLDDSAIEQLAHQVITTLDKVHRQVPVSAEAVYRGVVNEVARQQDRITDDATLDQLLRQALTRYARQGFTGQVDPQGRRYEFVSYAEMVVRSAITRAEVDGYCAHVTAAGHDLVIVSDVPGSCALCTPFEGAVISISGATTGTVEFTNSLGRPVTVTVKCSLAEARAAGLFHRNCRHTIRVWTADSPNPPGAVRLSEADRAQRRDANSRHRRNRILQRIGFVSTT